MKKAIQSLSLTCLFRCDFHTNKAQEPHEDHHTIKHWYIGGHSLGGTICRAMFAGKT
ncbi:alpha/beta hydrolase [Bacillus sp. SL00103]